MFEMTPELAEICGIHAGDGYMRVRVNGKGEVSISGSYDEKEYYDNHVIPLFNKIFKLNLKGKFFSGRTYGFVSYEKTIRDALLANGFPPGKKTTSVRVPKVILDATDKTFLCCFLRGLFDADGNLSFRKSYNTMSDFKNGHNHYPVLKLTTSSRFLAEGL